MEQLDQRCGHHVAGIGQGMPGLFCTKPAGHLYTHGDGVATWTTGAASGGGAVRHFYGDDCPGGHGAAVLAGMPHDLQLTAAEANRLRLDGDGLAFVHERLVAAYTDGWNDAEEAKS